jgi:hypothetical protein
MTAPPMTPENEENGGPPKEPAATTGADSSVLVITSLRSQRIRVLAALRQGMGWSGPPPKHRDDRPFLRATRERRQEASRRLPPLENGVRDPWTGR